MMGNDTSAKRAAFRKLHESGYFILPNPWDVGSARRLARMGFQALATTSAGAAFDRATLSVRDEGPLPIQRLA